MLPGCRRRRICPLTGRIAVRTSSGTPSRARVACPAATTTRRAARVVSPRRARLAATRTWPSATAVTVPREGPDAARRGGRPERGQVAAVVDGQVAGGEYAAARARGEERLELAALPGVESLGLEPDRPPEVGEPVERGQVAAVVGDGEGALGAQAGALARRLFQFAVEAREAVDGVQVQVQQVLLAEDGLGDRAEHARRDQARLVAGPRVVAAWVDQRHGPAGAGRPPGDGGADHAAAYDDDVRDPCRAARSLRQHYLDQVRRSEAARLPLSPR